MRKKTYFILFILVQLIVVLAIAGSHFATLQYGKRILLKTEPVDPRDLFYGDYVTLNYDISSLRTTLWNGEESLESKDHVYVVLEPGKLYYEPEGIFKDKPDVEEDEVVLHGIVRYVSPEGTIAIDYGIERYYVEEGTGKSIEQQRSGMEVAVRVAPWGQVAVQELVTKD